MLKDMLYEILMKATEFVFMVDAAEHEIDMNKNLFRRFLVRMKRIIHPILEVLWRIATVLVLTSMTGGLYLVWLVLKRMWKKRRAKRKDRRTRRKKA